MGYYTNPSDMAAARKLDNGTYDDLKAQLLEGELLGGLYDRVIFKNAVLLDSPMEYNEFEKQVAGGILERIGFYAVPATLFPDYKPD